MVTAYVLSGGGSLGAVQVGMLEALSDHGVTPDLLVGTSAGAINAAFVAGHGTGRDALRQLAELWAGLRRRDLFKVDPRRQLLAVSGLRDSLFSSDGLRSVVAAHVPFRLLEQAPIPVHVVATNLLSGDEVLISTGDPVTAVLASTAIPGVLPAVQREGLTLVDGGLANNAAISQACALGADRVYVLPTGFACALAKAPTGAFATAVQALSFLTQQRLIQDVITWADHAELHVLPPLCPLAISSADFGHGRELAQRAHAAAGAWLDAGMDRLGQPQRFLSLHHHPDEHDHAH